MSDAPEWMQTTYRHTFDYNGGKISVSLKDGNPDTIAAAEAACIAACEEVAARQARPLDEQYADYIREAYKALDAIIRHCQYNVKDEMELICSKDPHVAEMRRRLHAIFGLADSAMMFLPQKFSPRAVAKKAGKSDT